MSLLEKQLLTTAFITAARDNNLAALKEAFAKGAPVNSENALGENALFSAARHDNKEMADFLIANKININHLSEGGATALRIAIICEKEGMAESLLSRGANPNLGNNGNPDLFFPSTLQMLNCLLNGSADPDIRSSLDGRTPLIFFALKGLADYCKALIDAGADLNLRDNSGQTALHKAAQQGNAHVVRLLAEAGADIHLADNKGNTPYDIAGMRGQKEVAGYLKKFAFEQELSVFKKGLARPMTAPQKLRPVRAPKTRGP